MKPIRTLQNSALAAALAPASAAILSSAEAYEPIQTLSQGGVFPVNGLAGDAYGQVVAFNKDYLFVSSPGSQPDGKSISGAVFVYRWNGLQYQPTQVIATAGTGDHLGMLQILADGDWLGLSVTGTPIGPQVNDSVADQDFKGSVLLFRLNRRSGQWEHNQTLDSRIPGLEDLSAIEGEGVPVLLTEQGGNFGLRMALDAEHGWLFISALYQRQFDAQGVPPINAGKVYVFRLHQRSGLWQLAQEFTNPDGPSTNDGFGAAVAVKGRYAMIGNGPVFQGPHVGNSAVYVYRREGGTWDYVQRLTGAQTTVTPLLFPQFSPDVIDVGDSFGNAIALDDDHALITAPLETSDSAGAAFTGAAYFFHRERHRGEERWVLTQRIQSDDANSFTFGVFNVALKNRTAVIGDIGWTGTAATFQGAAHVYRRHGDPWEKSLTLSDAQGTPSAAFGAGIALGPNGRLAIGSSPFLGFFVPVIFRPPPAAFPPVAPGKVIIYEPSDG